MTELEVKAAVRQRDNFVCVGCGLTQAESVERFGRGLEVHRREPGSVYDVAGCETLCRTCHGRQPKTPAGEVRPGHRYKMVMLPGEHFALLSELAARNYRPVMWELLIALDRHLKTNGVEPPAWRNRRGRPRKTPKPPPDRT